MKIINNYLNTTPDLSAFTAHFNASTDDFIFFDIETTGLSSKNSICFLIGCLFVEDSKFILRQFFAKTPEDEKDLIIEFIKLIKNYKYLVHFNGSSFDIPFIKERAYIHKLDDSLHILDNITGIDLYKTSKSISCLLNLSNYKQKTIEAFLEITRKDRLDGAALIKLYKEYLKDYLLCIKTPNDESEKNINDKLKLMLLHNYEDVDGLTGITSLYSYLELLNSNFYLASFSNDNTECIKFNLILNTSIPVPVSLENEAFSLYANNNKMTLTVYTYNNELMHYYSNYKDYYYIPAEDKAIHKSVAFYVDKNHRTQATAANCYIKKNSIFIPHFEEFDFPVFKAGFKSKIDFMELTDKFINSEEQLLLYAKVFIKKNVP